MQNTSYFHGSRSQSQKTQESSQRETIMPKTNQPIVPTYDLLSACSFPIGCLLSLLLSCVCLAWLLLPKKASGIIKRRWKNSMLTTTQPIVSTTDLLSACSSSIGCLLPLLLSCVCLAWLLLPRKAEK